MGERESVYRPGGNSIYIGKKDLMGYVLAAVTMFTNGAKELRLKARGKLISRAVDVAEILRRRYLSDVKIKGINISTDELTSEDGSRVKVSAIEIILEKSDFPKSH